MLSEKLREEVWCAIAPVSHGIQRTRDEILDSKLAPLREFRRACLSYLETRLADFRKSERFEYVGRKLLNLTPVPDPDPHTNPALKNNLVDNTLGKLPIVDAKHKRAPLSTQMSLKARANNVNRTISRTRMRKKTPAVAH